ncbi:hypothetical protein B0T26DRAFT_675599 [Lasiosphaeria miniovina]|uniref:Uncharacterized protein n=1 Tax=Lasiosphaeria miniovina TaxID=1954250 RepID=A0AA40AK48_9PEZI|nr:uncharacterized protein B0T26DRAFT_675599 [Lasiosphaeria miniovina]KAK0717267.1 hypothetical protein B0T26DRAFT_675599 [Lasiosphaeria miniovina]
MAVWLDKGQRRSWASYGALGMGPVAAVGRPPNGHIMRKLAMSSEELGEVPVPWPWLPRLPTNNVRQACARRVDGGAKRAFVLEVRHKNAGEKAGSIPNSRLSSVVSMLQQVRPVPWFPDGGSCQVLEKTLIFKKRLLFRDSSEVALSHKPRLG